MKYDHREISELSDIELAQAYQNFKVAQEKRERAASHKKFKTMEFPPINPLFLELKEALITEMKKRKMEIT